MRQRTIALRKTDAESGRGELSRAGARVSRGSDRGPDLCSRGGKEGTARIIGARFRVAWHRAAWRRPRSAARHAARSQLVL